MGRYADEHRDVGLRDVGPPRMEYFMAVAYQVLQTMDKEWSTLTDYEDSVAFRDRWRKISGARWESFPEGYDTPRKGIQDIIARRFNIGRDLDLDSDF